MKNKKYGKYNISHGDLTILGWVVLKSDIMVGDKYDLVLAKSNTIDSKTFWQKLVNTDDQRNILFQSDYHESRCGNEGTPFHMLKSQFHMIMMLH